MIFTTTIDVAVILIFFLKGNIDIKPTSPICNDRKSAIIQSPTTEKISSKNFQKKRNLIVAEVVRRSKAFNFNLAQAREEKPETRKKCIM